MNMYFVNTECLEQTFGAGCNQTCHCASGSCHHISGSCSSGCAQGWTGQACQEAVKMSQYMSTLIIKNYVFVIQVICSSGLQHMVTLG